jgi:formate hydrogenlyase subunit 3/multisubunit Na+/H+ antiporter MnhD subunit
MTVTVYAFATTAGGFLLALAIILPVAGVLLSLVLGGRHAERIALALMPAGLGVAAAIAILLWCSGKPLVYILGGFTPPLGIALRADGFSAVMLVTAALVISAAGFFAWANFWTPPGVREARAPLAFWTLLQGLWAALNIVFLGGDLFNLYVALELLTFAALPLVCLDGRPETLAAALRYLLFALFGSVFYLLGAALLYGAYGTLDIVLLAARIHAEPTVWVAAGLMTAGLLAKTALFPLQLWLPPAHANAPAAASAVLSALVVKASFFVIVRLWFNVLPSPPNKIACAILVALGSAAILFGSVLALRQERLKLLIAYSTVAQIGYLFLMFPLAAGAHPWAADAWSGGLMQLLAHAFAKAAMFLAAGLIAESIGHDRIADLGGIGRAMPMTDSPRLVALREPSAARSRRRYYRSVGGRLPRELRLRRQVGANGCPASAVARGGSVVSGDRGRSRRGHVCWALSGTIDLPPIRRSHRRRDPSARPVRHRFAACWDREWRSER